MITTTADSGRVRVALHGADGGLITPLAARTLAARLLEVATEAERQIIPMGIFDIAVAATLLEEGGKVDHKDDPGGITNFGISIRFAGSIGLDVDGDGRTTAADIRALTRERAVEIYREHFWAPARCGSLPPAVAAAHFDAAVNAGQGRAAKLLQIASGADPDGDIGPATLRAVRGTPEQQLLADMVRARMAWQRPLDGYRTFGTGWERRCLRIHAAASRLL